MTTNNTIATIIESMIDQHAKGMNQLADVITIEATAGNSAVVEKAGEEYSGYTDNAITGYLSQLDALYPTSKKLVTDEAIRELNKENKKLRVERIRSALKREGFKVLKGTAHLACVLHNGTETTMARTNTYVVVEHFEVEKGAGDSALVKAAKAFEADPTAETRKALTDAINGVMAQQA